jgi:hypothetical protein
MIITLVLHERLFTANFKIHVAYIYLKLREKKTTTNKQTKRNYDGIDDRYKQKQNSDIRQRRWTGVGWGSQIVEIMY